MSSFANREPLELVFSDLHPKLREQLESNSRLTDAALWMVSIISRHKPLRPEQVDIEQLLQPEHEILIVMHTSGHKVKILSDCHKLCALLGDPHRFRNYAVGLVRHPLVIEWVTNETSSTVRQYSCQHSVSQFLRYLTSTAEFRRHLPESFPLVMLQRKHVANYRRMLLVRIRRGEIGQNGARKALQWVVRFLRWCQDSKGMLTGLDLDRISIRKGPERVRDVPTHEICFRFVDYVFQRRIPQSVKCCVLLALATGARPGELLKLTFEDIDVASHSVRLQSKGGAERWMPLGTHVWKILSDLLDVHHSGLIAPNQEVFKDAKGNPLRYDSVKDLIRKARQQGIYIDGMVALRHRWATDALEAGIPWGLVCYYLGHKNPDELRRYQHLERKKVFHEVQRAFKKRGLQQ